MSENPLPQDQLNLYLNEFNDSGISFERQVLFDCLSAYARGRDWTLSLFKYSKQPHLVIDKDPAIQQTGENVLKLDTGEVVIRLPVGYFRILENSTKDTIVSKVVTKKDGTEIWYHYTLEQVFEQIGIEGTTHWLAYQGDVKELTPIGPGFQQIMPENNAEEYMSQPYELEPLILYHAYFIDKYGYSPVQPLVTMTADYLKNSKREN